MKDLTHHTNKKPENYSIRELEKHVMKDLTHHTNKKPENYSIRELEKHVMKDLIHLPLSSSLSFLFYSFPSSYKTSLEILLFSSSCHHFSFGHTKTTSTSHLSVLLLLSSSSSPPLLCPPLLLLSLFLLML